MYNDRRYSLTRFSVNLENRAVEIRESFSEAINAVAGATVPVDFRDRFTETVRTVVMGAVAVVSSFSALAELAAAARVEKNTPAVLAGADALTARTVGTKNVPALFPALEEPTAVARMSANVVSSIVFAEAMHGAAYGGKNTPAVLETAEILTAYIICKKYACRFGACGHADGLDCRFKEYPGGFGRFGDSNLHDGGNVPDHGADSGAAYNPAGRGTED